jgi:hypothetical protein
MDGERRIYTTDSLLVFLPDAAKMRSLNHQLRIGDMQLCGERLKKYSGE